MFYSNNDNYMQDLYFYNQQPNMNTYNPNNPNMNSFPNNNPNMINGMYMGQNPNMFNANQSVNANNLYPSIYRIISPVVSRVIQNSNYQFLNEDVLNNMVDTVYNIVEGQIDYDEDNTNTSQNNNSSVANTSTTANNSTSTSTRTSETKTTQTTTTTRNNRNDSLLRDIIKILILKELLSRNNQMPNGMQFNQSQYYPGQNYTNMNF